MIFVDRTLGQKIQWVADFCSSDLRKQMSSPIPPPPWDPLRVVENPDKHGLLCRLFFWDCWFTAFPGRQGEGGASEGWLMLRKSAKRFGVDLLPALQNRTSTFFQSSPRFTLNFLKSRWLENPPWTTQFKVIPGVLMFHIIFWCLTQGTKHVHTNHKSLAYVVFTNIGQLRLGIFVNSYHFLGST